MATRLRKRVPRRKGPVVILVRLRAQFPAIYCRIGTEQQGREGGRLASRQVSKRSLTISATFRSAGGSIA